MAESSLAKTVAVVIPCYNEAASIVDVVKGFKQHLPQAAIHVFDNCSTDATAALAKQAGALVHLVPNQGKGNVVQAMFRDVDADYFILVDGDGTYPAAAAPDLLQQALDQQADMVVGCRMAGYEHGKSRPGHFVGNRLLTATVNTLFPAGITDLLSGYRVMSRRLVKSIPLFSNGFEVETNIAIHAVEVGAKTTERAIGYGARVDGGESKLNTLRDGAKITMEIFRLYKDYRPVFVYGLLASLFVAFSLLIGLPVVAEFIATGLVPRFPSAILAAALMILSFLSVFTGIILSAVSKSRREIKKLAFLSAR